MLLAVIHPATSPTTTTTTTLTHSSRSPRYDREADVTRKRARLGAEPPAGLPRGQTVSLRLQLPNAGPRALVDRRFLWGQTVGDVYDFVDVWAFENDVHEGGLASGDFTMAMSHPRRVFDRAAEGDLGLGETCGGQAKLYVTDNEA